MSSRGEATPSEIGSLFCEAYLRPVWQLETEARRGGEAWRSHQQLLYLYLPGDGSEEGGGNGIELPQTEFRLDTWKNFPAQYCKAEGR